ncbi:MAG: UDP-N-acetylmuramoyl-L-alanine--D-glutamate ligase, partial [Candidatus Sulfotelmatobacter sp.]
TCIAMAAKTRAQVFWFSRKKDIEQGAWIRAGNIVFRSAAGREKEAQHEIMQVSEIPLRGAHNLENVLAAVCVASLMGCAPQKIREAVMKFRAVEHRLEYVATVRGVDYYNDSKATNVDATIKAIESFPANIHLILGGKDKGSDYLVLNELLRQRVKRVYTIGAAAEKIESQIKGTEVVHAQTLESALRKANAVAEPGDVVLLAPACSSFDQFRSYEHRGQVFKEIVRGLG